jgi:hypothetical protein
VSSDSTIEGPGIEPIPFLLDERVSGEAAGGLLPAPSMAPVVVCFRYELRMRSR